MDDAEQFQFFEADVVSAHSTTTDPLVQPFLAARYNMEAFQKALMDGILPLDHRSSPAHPPLASLLAFGLHVRRLLVVLAAGANPNGTDTRGVTPIMALVYGHHRALTTAAGRLHMVRKGGGSSIHYQHVLMALIQAKADLDQRDATGNNALSLAARFDMGDIARVLVRYGARAPSALTSGNNVAQQVQRGLSERTIPLPVLDMLFKAKLAQKRNVISSLYSYINPTPYWADLGDMCQCDLCLKNPMEPDPVVVHLDALLTKVGFGGHDSPLNVLQLTAESPADPLLELSDAEISALCKRLREALASVRVSLRRHALLLVSSIATADRNVAEQLTKFVFEGLRAKTYYVSTPTLSTLYASSQGTGLVISLDRHTTISCICEGAAAAFSRTAGLGSEQHFIAGQAATDDVDRCTSVARLVADTIEQCDDDDIRPMMWEHVIVADGAEDVVPKELLRRTLVEEKQRREELAARRPLLPRPVAVSVADQDSSWVGGSIFASSHAFYCSCISANEYRECGASIVHRKCYVHA